MVNYLFDLRHKVFAGYFLLMQGHIAVAGYDAGITRFIIFRPTKKFPVEDMEFSLVLDLSRQGSHDT